MQNVHFILQGKGGVGKSFIAALLSQFLMTANRDLMVIDTDPVNLTLAGFKGLNAHVIKLLDDKNDIDASLFDKLLEELVLMHEGDSLIDNGASSFVRLSSYLLNNDIVGFLEENGKRVVIHVPIVGGQAIFDTLAGLESIIDHYPESCQVIVWLNEFQGEIENMGKTFFEMKVYQKYADRIAGLVTIPALDELADKAVKMMMKQRMTFEEAALCEDKAVFNVLAKRRVGIFKRDIFSQLDVLSSEGVF